MWQNIIQDKGDKPMSIWSKFVDWFTRQSLCPELGHIDMDGNMFIRYQIGLQTKGRKL